VKQAAADHIAVVDALYRFGAGQDLRDRGLFESALSADATLEFSEPARRLNAGISVLRGRRVIADAVFAAIENLDTTHTVTNPRITSYDGRHATLFALLEAQHLPRDDHSRHLLLKNICRVDLSRRDHSWIIDHARIDTVWFTGEPSVLFPAPVRSAVGGLGVVSLEGGVLP
jgi:hypothetical protein